MSGHLQRDMGILNRVIPSLSSTTAHLEYHQGGVLERRPFRDLESDVRKLAAFLRGKGIRSQQRVGLMAANGYELIVADLACMAAGVVVVPFDLAPEKNVEELCERYQLALMLVAASGLPPGDRVASVTEALAHAAPPPERFDPYVFRPDDILTFKFTSGSTGSPKAIETKAQSVDDTLASVQAMFRHGPGDKIMVFLPLTLLQQRFWVYSAIVFQCDLVVTTYPFAFHVMRRARPTVVMGVPEFFEQIRLRFLRDVARSRAHALLLSTYQVLNVCTLGSLGRWMGWPPFERLLGGRIRYLWSGSAALSVRTMRFFFALGAPIYQGYGMNEVCIVAKNCPGKNRMGSVGKLLPNRDVRIDATGQILVRNRYEVNHRYHPSVDEQENAVFLPDGFVCTGDQGYLDEDGYLYVTGRVKDLIVLTSGRKVAPAALEERLLRSEIVQCCMVHGTDRPYLVALIKLRDGARREQLEAVLQTVNATFEPDARILRYLLIDEPFSVENGLLSPQHKMRRREIEERYAKELASLYERAPAAEAA